MFLYIDPGTGSMLFSILVGAAATLFFLAKAALLKIKVILSGKKDGAVTDSSYKPYVIYCEGKQYWNVFKPVADQFEERKIPFLVTMGNHDHDREKTMVEKEKDVEWVAKLLGCDKSTVYRKFAGFEKLTIGDASKLKIGLDMVKGMKNKTKNCILVDAGDKFESTYNGVKNAITAHSEDMVIEYLIATHPDSDHIGSMASVFEDFQVNNLYKFSGEEFTTQKFKALKAAYDSEPNCKVHDIYNDVFNGTEDKFIYITSEIYIEFIDTKCFLNAESNGRSIVFVLNVYGTKVLMTGDADSQSAHKTLEHDYMTISHNYKSSIDFRDDDIYLIRALYNLEAKITTTYKVNITEERSILLNVWKALYENFNAHKVDYGYEIPYDLILQTIQNADSRIKSVSLKEPELDIEPIAPGVDTDSKARKLSYYGSRDFDLQNGYPAYIKLLGRNVVEGKIPLFEYDNRFKYEFGQKKIDNIDAVTENLKQLTSKASITLSKDSEIDNRLNPNEVVQLLGPSLVNEIEYVAYCNYRWESNRNIPADTDFRLNTNEKLYIVYTDTSGSQVEALYTGGDIIKSTFEIEPTDTYKAKGNTPISKDLHQVYVGKLDFFQIDSKNNIYKRVKASHTFNNTIKCCWVIDEVQGRNIIWDKFKKVEYEQTPDGKDIYELILDDKQHFIYSLDDLKSFEI